MPETLRDARIVTLDLSGMIAGAQFRGQFEQRFKAALEEAVDAENAVLLFVDELHTILGAGNAEGAMDAANMLKPLLARGELRMVGATTLSEYRQIERDGALARRFSPVMVEEPSVEDTVAILRGLRGAYEDHHGALIDDAALEAAARLSRPLHHRVPPARQGDRPGRPGRRARAAARRRRRRERPRRASASSTCAPRSRRRSTPRTTRTPASSSRDRRARGAHRRRSRPRRARRGGRRRGRGRRGRRRAHRHPRRASWSRASSSACRSSRATCTSAWSARTRPSRSSPTPSAAPASASPRATARWARSCSSARPASARPSWSRRWRSGCSRPRRRSCGSTCPSTASRTRSPG